MTTHHGFETFRKGIFENGGDNLFVDFSGVMRRIADNDLFGNGYFDIVFPNSHAYIERAPTTIYKKEGGSYIGRDLPHDSCWKSIVCDVDGDGYPDLIVCNAENGISSDLTSYIYWGGQNGLTEERSEFSTLGAYDAAVLDLNNNGLHDVIFGTAWRDHHNNGEPMAQKVFRQTAPREFEDVTNEYNIMGVATISMLCEDLSGDGHNDLVLANLRSGHEYHTDSFVYMGNENGFAKEPIRLPTMSASSVVSCDLNGDGYKEIVFSGEDYLQIFWSRQGVFSADDKTFIYIEGMHGQFMKGTLSMACADIDGDGIEELVIGTKNGAQIRKADDIEQVVATVGSISVANVCLADISGDNKCDIVLTQYTDEISYDVDSYVYWSDENYSEKTKTALATHGGMHCSAADLDGDGKKEIIFCNTMSGPAQLIEKFPVFVYRGNEQNDYNALPRVDYNVFRIGQIYAAADLNGNGFVDLVLSTGRGVIIYKGTADGPDPNDYVELIDLQYKKGGSGNMGGMLVGDFNKNGYLDILVSPWVMSETDEQLSMSVTIYHGSADGYSEERSTILPAFTKCAAAITLCDINGDGYPDFIYGHGDGGIGVYYGGENGFDLDNHKRYSLVGDDDKVMVFGLTTADIDKDGRPEVFVTTAGHYVNKASHLYILRDEAGGYPHSKQTKFETGGTTGFPALADLRNTGNLDLVLPFYSTKESRELPLRIFKSDGAGSFDFDHPQKIDCLSSIASSLVDLTGNGYPDMFICCHRNDIGHVVDSKLIFNSESGFDMQSEQRLLGYGPHAYTTKNQGNTMNRSDEEHYTSVIFVYDNFKQVEIEAQTPNKTTLRFSVRYGTTKQEVRDAKWSIPDENRRIALDPPEGTRYMQYRLCFKAPGFVNSPRLSAITFRQQ